MRLPVLAFFAACAGCGADLPDPVGAEWVESLGVERRASDAPAAELGWQAATDACPWAYELEVSYDILPLQEENNISTLVLTSHPRRATPRVIERGRPIPARQTAPGQLFYDGFRAGRRGARRDVHFGRTEVGPSAPTAACLARTWDPMEDALSLGWPKLTGRLTALGESWVGARVEGKCNKSACINPETHAGGRHNHHRPCVTPSWEERLVGVFETDAGRYAAIESTWSDGHGTAGVWSERKTLISIDHGRPVWSTTTIHHTFPQPTNERSWSPIERTWTLTAIDECGGSLASAGWQRPEEATSRAAEGLEKMAGFEERQRERQEQVRQEARQRATE